VDLYLRSLNTQSWRGAQLKNYEKFDKSKYIFRYDFVASTSALSASAFSASLLDYVIVELHLPMILSICLFVTRVRHFEYVLAVLEPSIVLDSHCSELSE